MLRKHFTKSNWYIPQEALIDSAINFKALLKLDVKTRLVEIELYRPRFHVSISPGAFA